MSNANLNVEPDESPVNWGHFRVVLAVVVLLLGVTYLKQPQLFNFKKAPVVADDPNVPHYYAYVPSAEDQQPEVLGASTDPTASGPMIINDDGSVAPVDMGQVLAANTQDVSLSLDSVKVSAVADSPAAISKYFDSMQQAENGPIDSGDFETALASNNQDLINQQAQKLMQSRDALLKLEVPQSLVKLQQLTVIQYNAAIGLMQNFTQSDQNPTLVGQYFDEFLKSQQDLDNENISVAQKLGSLDPYSNLYVAADGTPIATSSPVSEAASQVLSGANISSDGSSGQ